MLLTAKDNRGAIPCPAPPAKCCAVYKALGWLPNSLWFCGEEQTKPTIHPSILVIHSLVFEHILYTRYYSPAGLYSDVASPRQPSLITTPTPAGFKAPHALYPKHPMFITYLALLCFLK